MVTERSEDERARLLEAAVKRGTEAALDEFDQRRNGEVQVDGPFGLKLRGKGRAVLVVITIAAILLGLYVHDKNSEAAGLQRQREHMTTEERLNEVVYVLTLSQEERERLNLSIPDSLRRKQRAQEDRAR